jgi:integrase
MLVWQGLTPRWNVPLDEIDPKVQEKRGLTMDQTLWLLEHTPAGSVEEAVIALKMRTGIREVELADLKVRDFDPEERVINPVLRSKGRARGGKQKERRHLYPLADDIVELLMPFTYESTPEGMQEKAPEDPLFTTRTGALQQSSLRRRLVAASERANAKLGNCSRMGRSRKPNAMRY